MYQMWVSCLLPPAFRRNGEGNVFTGVCRSTPTGETPIWPMGDIPSQVRRGEGTPSGWWRVPHLADQWVPPIGTGWGYNPSVWTGWGTPPPSQDWMGHPPIVTGWGTFPPPPPPPPPAAERALATQWAVCLLRSRGRTFLLNLRSFY